MKTLTNFFAAALLSFGSPLICPSNNAPGASVYATPDSSFGICWEDLPVWASDLDYNDQIVLGTVDSTGEHATMVFSGASAALNDVLKYQGTVLFSNSSHPLPVTISTTPGAEIVLNLKAGIYTWKTGTAQAIVWQNGPAVPEPGSLFLLGTALTALVIIRHRA